MFDPQAKQRNESRKRIAESQKGVLRFLTLFLAMLMFCGVLIAISYLFYVRRIEVLGAEHYASEELSDSCGVQKGNPLSSVIPAEIEKTLKDKYHWLQSVHAKKNWFGKVTIEVEEYHVAYGVRAENGCFLLSDSMFVLESIPGLTDEYLQIVLPDGTEFHVGENVLTRYGEVYAAKEICDVLKRTDKLSVYRLDFSSPYSYRILTQNGVTIVIGNTDSLELKLELAISILEERKGQTWQEAEVNVTDIKKATFRILK